MQKPFGFVRRAWSENRFRAAYCCCGVGVVGFEDGWLVGAGALFAGAGFTLPRTDPLVWRSRLAKIDKDIEVTMNSTAAQVVALLKIVVAPRGPKAVWLPAPPKAAAMSALCPLCNRTTMMMNRQTIMWTIVSRTVIIFSQSGAATAPSSNSA